MDNVDVLIVGAGLAGLSCARTLTDAGKRVQVLERSSVLGGRCSSKSPGGGAAPADFGPVFVHGDNNEFLQWIESAGQELMAGWPRVVEGSGTPCQPQAFDPLQRRFAVKSGIRRLPEALSLGLDVVTGAQVENLEWGGSSVEASTSDGRRFRGRELILAVALEQARPLVATLAAGQGAEAARKADALLGQFASLCCLTLTVSYPASAPTPAWDLWYPEASPALLLVSNEGTKRNTGGGPLLVFQARPTWSFARLEAAKETWTSELFAEAAGLLGPWAASPTTFLAHRWKYARLAPSDHLYRPLLLDQPFSTARIGLIGDLFDPGGGLQGAWLSGRQLAHRLVQGL